MVELRDLTRRRKKLQGNLNAEKNRIQKVLEVANVKIGNIVSDVFGVSGQSMVKALLSGEDIPPEELADMAKKRLRQKIPELIETLRGHQMNDHHRWLIEQSVEHAVLLDRQIEQLEEKIQQKLAGYQKQNELLQTIPGIKEMTAACILAEIGPDMSPFATSKKLCNWAGICPGNNRSAGKSKQSRIKKANRFLMAALVQAGCAAARERDSAFQRQFHRWVGHLGRAKASVAIAHSLLRVVYIILQRQVAYESPEPGRVHKLEQAKLVRHHTKRLRQLGADDALLAEIAQQLETKSEQTPCAEAAPKRIHEASPAKVRRGALGFRARQTRKQLKKYSVVEDQSGVTPSQARPPGKRTARPRTTRHKPSSPKDT